MSAGNSIPQCNKLARNDALDAQEVAKRIGKTIRGGGSKGFWQQQAEEASAMRDQSLHNDDVMAQLQMGSGLDGAVGKMRACLDILNGNKRASVVERWRKNVKIYAKGKAKRLTERYFVRAAKMQEMKPGHSASYYILGNPQARAIASADDLRTFATKNKCMEQKRLRTHQQMIDVQTADSHWVRQHTLVRLKEAEQMRNQALQRGEAGKLQRMELMQDKVSHSAMDKCYQKMLKSRWSDDPNGKEERSRILMETVLNQWTNQILLRAVSYWMASWWSDNFPTKPIVPVVNIGRIKASDMVANLSLNTNPAVFLVHAEDQRMRLQQERKASSTKGKVQTYQIFESQLKADIRQSAIVDRKRTGAGRCVQAEYRRHHIEPAGIYISIWHPPDKRRALRRIAANRARWMYEKAKWVKVDTGGPAGMYYYHRDSNQMSWELPGKEVTDEMARLDEIAKELERRAGYEVDDGMGEQSSETSVHAMFAKDSLTKANYVEAYEGPN